VKLVTSPPLSPRKARERSDAGKGSAGPESESSQAERIEAACRQATEAMNALSRALRGVRLGPARPSRTDAAGPTRSAVRFWHAWREGELDGLPYTTCSFAQAYAAYRHFAQRSGELPCTRNSFTHALLVASEAAGQPVRGKIMRLGAYPALKSERMLLVADPPERTQGAWATACSHEFSYALASYVSDVPRSPVRALKRQRKHA
jgi:hypothetical protein